MTTYSIKAEHAGNGKKAAKRDWLVVAADGVVTVALWLRLDMLIRRIAS